MNFDFDPLIKALDGFIAKADDDLKDQLADEGFVDADGTVESENSFEDKLTQILENEQDAIIGILKDSDSIEDAVQKILDRLSEDATVRDAMEAVFGEEMSSAVEKLASSYLEMLDSELSIDIMSDRTTDWIKSWSSDLADLMHLSTKDGLESTLNTALKDGKSIEKVTSELMDWYGFSRERARKTAITEMLTAHSAAANEAFKQSPSVEKKRWRHTGAYKNHPRQNHVAMDGVEVLKGEHFELVGADGNTYYPDYPRDPVLPASERVNCHCLLQAVVSNDILGLSAEEKKKLQEQAIADDNDDWEKELDAKNKAKAGIDD